MLPNQKMRLCLTKLLGLKIALGNARGHALLVYSSRLAQGWNNKYTRKNAKSVETFN